MSYSRQDVHRLAGETGADPRTVRKWLAGEKVVGPIEYALCAAAERLGIALPPQYGEGAEQAGA